MRRHVFGQLSTVCRWRPLHLSATHLLDASDVLPPRSSSSSSSCQSSVTLYHRSASSPALYATSRAKLVHMELRQDVLYLVVTLFSLAKHR